ncbi:MAG: NADH-quinone oxidoreductase subunit M [Candidatus Thermoplasmatota archaeon]|jgi:NADH-quinone oxidoreductase subunit M|nr:NADH-quinone oxidoreductase subunit M [Candidatus Thermoplasmatota archaeon]
MFLAFIFGLLFAISLVTFLTGRYSSRFAMAGSILILVLVAGYLLEVMQGYSGGITGKYSYPLNAEYQIFFSVGINGFTGPLLLAAAIVFPLSIYISLKEKYDGKFYGLMMLAETGLFGVLISRDMILFYIFWEFVLVPVFFLILMYGGEGRNSVALKFFVYTHIGSALILLAIFSLYAYYFSVYGIYTMQMSALTQPSFVSQIPLFWELFIVAGLMIGFLVKLPVFPFHAWLPDSYDVAPYPVTVAIAGGLSLMGGYGLFGIMLGLKSLFPALVLWILVGISIVSLIYFALTAMFQTSIKRMMAYASAGSMGFVLLAFAAGIMEESGVEYNLVLSGGMFQILAHAIIISLLFVNIFFIKLKAGTDTLGGLGGIYREAPVLSTIMLGGLLASLGLPGLAGFIGEFSILGGSFQAIGYLIFFVIFSMIITASYHIWMAQRTLYGPYNEHLGGIRDLSRPEMAVLGAVLILILVLGVFPSPLFSLFSSYAGGII